MDRNCVILCGGKSSRMGENKIFLPFGNTSLIIYQYKKLSKNFQNIFISSKNIYLDSIKSIFQKENINIENKILIESDELYSPLFGIKNAFEILKKENIFFISCDAPFIESRVIESILKNVRGYEITCVRDKNKIHPLIGSWNFKMKNKIELALNQNHFRITNLLKNAKSKILYFDCEFLNINTREDYQKALTLDRKNE